MATTDIMRTILDKAKDPYLKTCKYKFCKKEFRATRLNQEYCCLACKGKANNLIAKNKRDISKKINTILLKNREILHNCYSKGSINVTLNELNEPGFIYEFHTHTKKEPKSGKMVRCYYDYGLIQGDEQALNFITIWKLT